jgi:glycosyltransferase involved in cell wall biosynthesis
MSNSLVAMSKSKQSLASGTLAARNTKILQIGNYPPPMCGWAIQTKLVTEELRRRGVDCKVLKINENRQLKSPEYIDVQNGRDYIVKVARFAWRGYRLNPHVNGMSRKGYVLALLALLFARAANQPGLLTFHGGLSQDYFPRPEGEWLHGAFRLLFWASSHIACDSGEIKQAIGKYGVRPEKITPIATFSQQYLKFNPVSLSVEITGFLSHHPRTFFSYVSFRPEYRLGLVRSCMARYAGRYPEAGFIWLGFPEKELLEVRKYVQSWAPLERERLLLLGNLKHDEFLTLMTRCFVCLRTPACDGVAASVLEAIALGVPVVASENGRRPAGVITYADADVEDMFSKLAFVTENYSHVKADPNFAAPDDNIARMADWLTGETALSDNAEPLRVAHGG